MGRELEPPEFGFKPKSRRNSKRFAPETFYAQRNESKTKEQYPISTLNSITKLNES
jgi:hypothetical protein